MRKLQLDNFLDKQEILSKVYHNHRRKIKYSRIMTQKDFIS